MYKGQTTLTYYMEILTSEDWGVVFTNEGWYLSIYQVFTRGEGWYLPMRGWYLPVVRGGIYQVLRYLPMRGGIYQWGVVFTRYLPMRGGIYQWWGVVFTNKGWYLPVVRGGIYQVFTNEGWYLPVVRGGIYHLVSLTHLPYYQNTVFCTFLMIHS